MEVGPFEWSQYPPNPQSVPASGTLCPIPWNCRGFGKDAVGCAHGCGGTVCLSSMEEGLWRAWREMSWGWWWIRLDFSIVFGFGGLGRCSTLILEGFFFFFPIAFWIPNEWTYLYLACNRHLQAREQQTVSAEDQIVNIIPTGHMVTVMVSSLSPSCRAPVRWYVSELGQPHSNKTLFKIQEVDRIWPMGRSVRALI